MATGAEHSGMDSSCKEAQRINLKNLQLGLSIGPMISYMGFSPNWVPPLINAKGFLILAAIF